ncbi:MAG TPA: beta-N-acetylglucosaminidase domain-containing protein, partial [Trueperaceae bacterium]
MSASAHRAIRGAIEGFYGTFYTQPERLRLLQFLGAHDYNHYIYAPKNDRQHRARWREPYPERIMTQFQEATRVARASGIDFCYSLSPGVDLSYASEDDFRALTSKLQAFYDLGVRSFSLLLDDIHPEFRAAADRTRYRSYGEAHADLSNRVYAWLSERDEPCSLSMCPTDYHGTPPFSDYLHQLGCDLH